ncbi:MAG: outer membrane lipid asymmetry maintenance protein MlaD [Pseudomonadales bacterium]|nr:outer membrane lipid asymmetry maintenance protein MlaD [Pseudomonadales bacterium]NIX06504.1 outer membrane lipid asymmetry maintenance protein MlaD [Pseudomonadales bacterium]
MANSVTETLLGAAVLVTAAGFVAYASQTGGRGETGGDRYELMANFVSAEGIATGTDVRLAGVKIGSVVGMKLNPETYQAQLTFTIQENVKVPDDSEVKVASEGLLGGSFLEITPGGSEFMLAEGDEVVYTQSSVSFLNLMLKFVTGGDEES